MICPNCGNDNKNGGEYCAVCGFKFETQDINFDSGQNQYQGQYQDQYQNQGFSFDNMGGVNTIVNNNMNVAKESVMYYKSIEDVLIDPTEYVIATYGNNYIQSFVASRDASQFAFILTNKRIYFKGTSIVAAGGSVSTMNDESILDLEDITGTKFRIIQSFVSAFFTIGSLTTIVGLILLCLEKSPVPGEISGVIFFAGLFLVIIPFIILALTRQTVFCVEYAGGSLMANIKLFGMQSAHDFNRQIRRAKDKICGR